MTWKVKNVVHNLLTGISTIAIRCKHNISEVTDNMSDHL